MEPWSALWWYEKCCSQSRNGVRNVSRRTVVTVLWTVFSGPSKVWLGEEITLPRPHHHIVFSDRVSNGERRGTMNLSETGLFSAKRLC
ncbi:hypothetical protein N665_0071s0039 [Sinapis alba]|nr:hypothetical protein N665_0071s0039 [Sinapis alba]